MEKKEYRVHDAKSVDAAAHSQESLKKYVEKANSAINEYMEKDTSSLHVTLGVGNIKTGSLVTSVSLLPIINCGNCGHCANSCYDWHGLVRYPSALKSRAKNWVLYKKGSRKYFDDIMEQLNGKFRNYRLFRWNVGGDVPNIDYLFGIISVADGKKDVKHLLYTKRYDLVNKLIDAGLSIPDNLQIIFSGWPGLKIDNPYDFPVSSPLFAGGECAVDPKTAYHCEGNCGKCDQFNMGCWTLKHGQSVVFNAH